MPTSIVGPCRSSSRVSRRRLRLGMGVALVALMVGDRILTGDLDRLLRTERSVWIGLRVLGWRWDED